MYFKQNVVINHHQFIRKMTTTVKIVNVVCSNCKLSKPVALWYYNNKLEQGKLPFVCSKCDGTSEELPKPSSLPFMT